MENNKVDQSTIKEFNKKQILSLLRQKEVMVKRELSKELGVSVPTVISNTNELIKDGIIEEAGVATSTGGRKPVVLRFLKNARYAFGVDLMTGKKVRIVLLNLNYEVICDRSFDFDGEYEFSELMERISIEVQKILSTMAINKSKILGIGFSVPGTVNEETKVLEIAPNLSLTNVDFNNYQIMFDFPIYVENESNVAAYAEYKMGVCKNDSDMVYISVNEGIGAGVVADNKIYKGHSKRAGELGHMIIRRGGNKCVCGRLGCWNAYVSGGALINAYNKEAGEKIATLREFFQQRKQGDTAAVKLWKEYIENMSVGIQSIIHIFDPHYIVLGGEMANYADILLDELKSRVFDDTKYYSEKDVCILVSELKEDASVLGAALIPLGKFMDVEAVYTI
ncbi:ROK family transcriptional regulator [Christensenellaceae bacterium OttesenSCG-928-K19]|nr:ROK family transcriptional regulator [Christensenellaceae bacterium OttesenSCG-928-K19]